MNINRMNKMNDKKTEITTIYLIRHGESVGNLNRICLGHTDLDLTDLGYKQAECTAEALSDVDFAGVYSSDLIRAVHTAEPHAKKRGLEVIKDDKFRELFFGTWENASVLMLKEKFNEQFTIGWRQNFGTFTAPEGESVVNMAERMALGLKNVALMHRGDKILVASHAAAIRALWGKISGLEPHQWADACPFPTNASYSVIECENGVLKPVSYSNDGHLGELVTFIQQ
jgi:broad specificity phosphatase PhoE